MTSAVQRISRRVLFGRPVVVVSGLPRSGTSMLMQMLASGGLPILSDGARAADESNPKGYYELERVLALDKGGDTTWLRGAKGKAVKVVSALLPHLPERYNYQVVFMQRDLDEVIASQADMLARRGSRSEASADPARLAAAFREHLQKVQTLLARRTCFDVLDLAHRDVVSHPLDAARRIVGFLGVTLDVDRMAAAVDPQLYRNRR